MQKSPSLSKFFLILSMIYIRLDNHNHSHLTQKKYKIIIKRLREKKILKIEIRSWLDISCHKYIYDIYNFKKILRNELLLYYIIFIHFSFIKSHFHINLLLLLLHNSVSLSPLPPLMSFHYLQS